MAKKKGGKGRRPGASQLHSHAVSGPALMRSASQLRSVLQSHGPRTDLAEVPYTDAHVVLLTASGEIIDRTPRPKIPFFKTDGAVRFVPFPRETQVRLYLQFLQDHRARMAELDRTNAWHTFVHNPQAHNCWMNAVAAKNSIRPCRLR